MNTYASNAPGKITAKKSISPMKNLCGSKFIVPISSEVEQRYATNRIAGSAALHLAFSELGDNHTELQQQLMHNIGYATSETLRFPGEVVRSVRFAGPSFIADD
jgi:hypothetical protein